MMGHSTRAGRYVLGTAFAVLVLTATYCTSAGVHSDSDAPTDDHCILHSLIELDIRSDRLVARLQSAASGELRRAADTIAFERRQRRHSLESWLQHDEGDHQPRIIRCSASATAIMPRGDARATAALAAALVQERECGLELVRLDGCEGEATKTHALIAAVGASYRRDVMTMQTAAAMQQP